MISGKTFYIAQEKEIMRGKAVVLLLALTLLTILTIAGIWTQIIPQYEAHGQVRMQLFIRRLVFKTNDDMAIIYEKIVNAQMSIMRSTIVLSRVLRDRDVEETQWYKKPHRSIVRRLQRQKIGRMERLKNALLIQHRPRTEIIDVFFSDTSAEDAALILNTVLDQYIRHHQEASDRERDELYRLFEEHINSLKSEIEDQEKVIDKLHKSSGITDPEEPTNDLSVEKQRHTFDEMSLLEKEIAELEQKRELLDAISQRLEQRLIEPRPVEMSIVLRATVPNEPHNDRRILYTAVVLGTYLILGGCIVVSERRHTV